MERIFRTYLKEHIPLDQIKLKDPIAIHAMPGMGMVGKNAVDHIIKKLKPQTEKILDIYSTALPSNIIIENDGTFNAPKIEFYMYHNDDLEMDLILITGDAQPKSIMGTNNLSAVISDNLHKLNVRFIISLAATPVNTPKDTPKIFMTVTNPDDIEKFKIFGVKNFIRGAVTGMNGLVVAFLKMEYGIDGCILLSETYPHFIEDLNSSISLVNFLSEYIKVDIDIEELKDKAGQARDFYESLIKKKKKKTKGPKAEDLGYIR
ncbi:MAG: hypothetical protein EAX96_16085 [Candidatus Lokiarchaeota archaeon]|nr:hypothetical protein [Candidatus Lokiarchaeota archaeon]